MVQNRSVSRRRFLGGAGALVFGVFAPSLFLDGCGSLVPSSGGSEPELATYLMPYGATLLFPGPSLDLAYDELAMLAALQGLVNRQKPTLYIEGLAGPNGMTLEQFWWEKMQSLGWSVTKKTPYQASGLMELLSLYGHHSKGLCVWDPTVPSTENVAATIAGVEDLLPVAYRPGSGTLYTELRKAGWGVGAWLVQQDGSPLFTGKGTIPGTTLASSGSAKDDAYLWAKTHYLDTGKTDATRMAYYIDAYWLHNPSASTFWNNTLVNHDYYVANRGFFFDLDPWNDEAPVDDPMQKPGTDAATLQALLLSGYHQTGGKKMIDVGGFVPWAFKYTNYGKAGGTHSPVATEWEYAEILSAYNAFMEADALGYSALPNASFTQHFPLAKTYPQPAPPTKAELEAKGWLQPNGTAAPKRFFAFYVGDFDSPAWLYQTLPTLWTDPARGEVPLSWAFDPNLSLRAAPMMAWTRATRTSMDSFVAGDSGAGYLNPGGLQTPRSSGLPSGIQTWANHCARFYQQWDIGVTGFIIDGNAPPLNTDCLDAYAGFSPVGTAGQKVPNMTLVKGMPVLTLTTDLGSTPSGAISTVEAMFTDVASPQFGLARAVLQSPSWYKQVAEALSAQGIVVVDLITLMRLVAEQLQSVGSVDASATAAQLTVASGQIQVSVFQIVQNSDGVYQVGTAGGQSAIVFGTDPYASHGPSYLYLSVPSDSSLLAGQPKTLWLQVTYYDQPAGLGLLCEYDSNNPAGTQGGAYTATSEVTTSGSAAWKTVLWSLPGADFTGAQNGGADLRIDGWPGLAIREVLLMSTQPNH